jgi:Carboxypeptidase regulatory-like domain
MKMRSTVVWMCLSLLLLAEFASAQDSKKETQLRTVTGIVLDKSENPLPGSVVFLKNVRTNSVISRFADKDGNYRFSGLDPNADYEVHAEADGYKSAVRTMSALDSRREMTLNLKIDKKKS